VETTHIHRRVPVPNLVEEEASILWPDIVNVVEYTRLFAMGDCSIGRRTRAARTRDRTPNLDNASDSPDATARKA
jgi:hypothetical protein